MTLTERLKTADITQDDWLEDVISSVIKPEDRGYFRAQVDQTTSNAETDEDIRDELIEARLGFDVVNCYELPEEEEEPYKLPEKYTILLIPHRTKVPLLTAAVGKYGERLPLAAKMVATGDPQWRACDDDFYFDRSYSRHNNVGDYIYQYAIVLAESTMGCYDRERHLDAVGAMLDTDCDQLLDAIECLINNYQDLEETEVVLKEIGKIVVLPYEVTS